MSDQIVQDETKNGGAARAKRSNYQPSAKEQQALSRQAERSEAEAPAPRVRIDGSSKVAASWLDLRLDHPDVEIGRKLLAEALGSTSDDFVDGLIAQLINATSPGQQLSESNLNFALSVIKNIRPNDQVEAMLAAQMVAVHMATMRLARQLAHVDNLPQLDSNERAFNKLARTYTTQMEALKRYRTGGEQKVTVQHVSVNDGGQAIVGNVVQPQRAANRQQSADAVPALTDSRQTPMPIIEQLQGEVIPLKPAQENDE
jgi:hypothetical protein